MGVGGGGVEPKKKMLCERRGEGDVWGALLEQEITLLLVCKKTQSPSIESYYHK